MTVIDVILPVLDEAAAIPWVLRRMPDGLRPIVVDNGSTDGSPMVAAGLGAEVVVAPRRGFGAACFEGLLAARSDVVCFMDCDGSLDPSDLHLVADPVVRGDADLMLGERQAVDRAWPMHARILNRTLAWRVRRLTGVPARDLGPMRAARRDTLLALDLRDRRFGWPLEMVLRAASAGLRVGSVQVPYHPRTGRSKVTGTLTGTFRAVHDMARMLR
jgi:glycosyltransferase involved in cell wall biosynthesis